MLLEGHFHDVESKLSGWRKSLAQRTSVIKAVSPDYPILLKEFVSERPSYLGKLARDYMKESAAA